MHWENKNPISEALNNAAAFQNGRRCDDESGIGAGAIAIEGGAIGGDGGEGLQLAMGDILEKGRVVVVKVLVGLGVAGEGGALEGKD